MDVEVDLTVESEGFTACAGAKFDPVQGKSSTLQLVDTPTCKFVSISAHMDCPSSHPDLNQSSNTLLHSLEPVVDVDCSVC